MQGAKQGAKGKYNPQAISLICDAIAETGRDLDGIAAAGIASNTFYRWLSEKRDFSDAVEASRARFRSTSIPKLRSWAKQALSNTLEAAAEGREVVTITTTTGTDSLGQTFESETIQRKPAMLPVQQAFNYVMGREIDLIAWLRQGVDLGVLPKEFMEKSINEIDGVTARIRSQIEGRSTEGQNPSPNIDPTAAIATALGLSNTVTVSAPLD